MELLPVQVWEKLLDSWHYRVLAAAAAGTAALVALRCLRPRQTDFPEVPGFPLVGVLPKLGKIPDDFVEKLEGWMKEYGKDGVCEYNLMGMRFVLVACKEGLDQIMHARPYKITRSTDFSRFSEVLHGLFTAEGESWKRQRRIISPAFNAKNTLSFFPLIKRVVDEATQKCDAAVGSDVNFTQLTRCLSAEVIATTAFGKGFGVFRKDKTKELAEVDHCMRDLGTRAFAPFAWWKLPFLGRFEHLQSTFNTLTGSLSKFMHENHKDKRAHTILGKLDQIAEAGEKLSHEDLLGNVVTLFVAGTDTTNINLTWALYLLAKNPEQQAHVAREVRAKAPNGVSTHEQLDHLLLVQGVWAETLRMHSPAPVVFLTAAQPFELLGRTLPSGTHLTLLNRLHANICPEAKSLGTDLDDFRPGRWIAAGGEALIAEAAALQGVFFGVGSRTCPGQRLAELEGQLFLAEFLRRFEVGGDVPSLGVKTSFTQNPDRDVVLRLAARRD